MKKTFEKMNGSPKREETMHYSAQSITDKMSLGGKG